MCLYIQLRIIIVAVTLVGMQASVTTRSGELGFEVFGEVIQKGI